MVIGFKILVFLFVLLDLFVHFLNKLK